MIPQFIAKFIFLTLLGHWCEVKLGGDEIIYQTKSGGKVITKYKVKPDKEQIENQKLIDNYERDNHV